MLQWIMSVLQTDLRRGTGHMEDVDLQMDMELLGKYSLVRLTGVPTTR